MKTRRSIALTVLSTFTAIIILSPTALAATQSQSLNLSMTGMIVNAGHQSYSFSGGSVVAGEILGNDLSGQPIAFSVSADVVNLNTHGSGSISASAGPATINVALKIIGETPAAVFPLNPTTLANCDLSSQHCTSEIPILFNGVASITETGMAGSISVPVAIESPYWNPFGGPIIILSLDATPLVFLVVTYTQATIDWKNVQLQGVVTDGTLGTEPVTGAYTTVSNSHEDLVQGLETDSHLITFTGMSDKSLNGQGSFNGLTTIPPISLGINAFDCTSSNAIALGVVWPFGPGTCTLTGASSSGQFQMNGANGAKISGSYGTMWSIPSEFTGTVVSATVIQH